MLEYNFDGLIGPTHNFSGLSFGNLASIEHRFSVSNPKAAARQGLAKMRLCHQLGLKQAFIPPHERPSIQAIRALGGYSGSDRKVLSTVNENNRELLYICSSASAMWTANAATISPSLDTEDQRVHITPANLLTEAHRSIETKQTTSFLKMIFLDPNCFVHHDPLPSANHMSDEGAANHLRISATHSNKALEVFVYGKAAADSLKPQVYPARQSLSASKAVAHNHRLIDENCLFVQQNPGAIDLGVFHNDVISTGNENVLLMHESAYVGQAEVLKEIRTKLNRIAKDQVYLFEIKEDSLPLKEAVATYFFNSQIVTIAPQRMVLIAPIECEENDRTRALIAGLIAQDNPLQEVRYINLRESMHNGGGPACLRLRAGLTEEEAEGIHPGFILDEARFDQLEGWIDQHYPERLEGKDLADYSLLDQSRRALDELTQIVQCGSIYPFQKA